MGQILKRVKFHLTKRYKPQAVHVEAAFIDTVWEVAKTKIKEFDKWYLMTPANYNYFKGSFNTNYSKSEISKILQVRYKILQKLIGDNNKIGLHIHLSLAMNLTYTEQEKIIQESINWFKETMGFVPTEIVFGWWLYNKYSEAICKKYHLKIIKQEDYNSIHDYNWQGVIKDDE